MLYCSNESFFAFVCVFTTGVTIRERDPNRSSGAEPSDHSHRPVLWLAKDPAPLHAGPSRRRANSQPPHFWLRELWKKDQLHLSEQGLPPASLHPCFLPLQHHYRLDSTSQHQDSLIMYCTVQCFGIRNIIWEEVLVFDEWWKLLSAVNVDTHELKVKLLTVEVAWNIYKLTGHYIWSTDRFILLPLHCLCVVFKIPSTSKVEAQMLKMLSFDRHCQHYFAEPSLLYSVLSATQDDCDWFKKNAPQQNNNGFSQTILQH